MSKWTYTFDLKQFELKFVDGKLTLQEMAMEIFQYLKSFPMYGDEYLDEITDDDFMEIVDGGLHTIAYFDYIYEEDSSKTGPSIEDYDRWKNELYDWADSVDERKEKEMEREGIALSFFNTPRNAWIIP